MEPVVIVKIRRGLDDEARARLNSHWFAVRSDVRDADGLAAVDGQRDLEFHVACHEIAGRGAPGEFCLRQRSGTVGSIPAAALCPLEPASQGARLLGIHSVERRELSDGCEELAGFAREVRRSGKHPAHVSSFTAIVRNSASRCRASGVMA